MAKHRKTRQEKRAADLRHVTYHLESLPSDDQKSTVKLPGNTVHLEAIHRTKAATVNYSYVSHDLKKTSIVTTGVIIAQIFLFLILNRV